ncbi:MAG: hypothetical protein ABIJ97_03120 [Bacteroidota bacterium]
MKKREWNIKSFYVADNNIKHWDLFKQNLSDKNVTISRMLMHFIKKYNKEVVKNENKKSRD